MFCTDSFSLASQEIERFFEWKFKWKILLIFIDLSKNFFKYFGRKLFYLLIRKLHASFCQFFSILYKYFDSTVLLTLKLQRSRLMSYAYLFLSYNLLVRNEWINVKTNSTEKEHFHRKQFGNKLFLLFAIFIICRCKMQKSMHEKCYLVYFSSVFYCACFLSFEQSEESELIAVIKA